MRFVAAPLAMADQLRSQHHGAQCGRGQRWCWASRCAQSGPASPRLGFASGGGGAGSPAQACPGCAGVRTPEVWRVLESGPTC